MTTLPLALVSDAALTAVAAHRREQLFGAQLEFAATRDDRYLAAAVLLAERVMELEHAMRRRARRPS